MMVCNVGQYHEPNHAPWFNLKRDPPFTEHTWASKPYMSTKIIKNKRNLCFELQETYMGMLQVKMLFSLLIIQRPYMGFQVVSAPTPPPTTTKTKTTTGITLWPVGLWPKVKRKRRIGLKRRKIVQFLSNLSIVRVAKILAQIKRHTGEMRARTLTTIFQKYP